MIVIKQYVLDTRDFQRFTDDTSAWCRQNLPKGSKLLVHDAGYIAFSTNFQLVDMVGLKTPSAIPLNRDITYPGAGQDRSKAVSRLAEKSDCDYLILVNDWPPIETLVSDLSRMGWEVKLLHQNELHSVYRIKFKAPAWVTAGRG